MGRKTPRLALAGIAALAFLPSAAPAIQAQPAQQPNASAGIGQSYGRLPLAFEPNRGQGPRAAFLARGAGYSIALQATEALFALGKRDRLSMRLIGANKHPALVPERQLPGKVNYLLGNDPSGWVTGLPTYARVKARGVYEGIDLAYYGRQGKLEYDFILHPGADPDRISFGFEGARSVRLDPSGSLAIRLETGTVRQPRPTIYQQIDGARRAVEGRFVLRGKQVGFALGPYDRTETLVIDPQLVYSTYLGGGSYDRGYGIAVDSAGAAYVTGYTESADFPVAGPLQGSFGGGFEDAFVVKLTPAGNALAYSTYLGGNDSEEGSSIAVDSSGAAYVTGSTSSTNFPTANPYQPVHGAGVADAFVAKLDASGSGLVYSTYLGGTGADGAKDIAVDGTGSAYIAGETGSTNFPTQNAYQPTLVANSDPTHARDAFLTKLTPSGSALVYSTYLGGGRFDSGTGVGTDSSGAAYVTGGTYSLNFPLVNPYQSALAGPPNDVFVTKFDASGGVAYSTYLGGNSSDWFPSIAVDGAGSAYVSGETQSSNFPTVNAYQGSHGGVIDGFVTKLAPDGNSLVYSTYLGGNDVDYPGGIAVDATGSAYVGGFTGSYNYPTAGPCPRKGSGLWDAFVTQLSPAGSGLRFSTYLGGSDYDNTYQSSSALAIDGAGAAYITGFTNSINFPVAGPAQAASAGASDAFVTKLRGDAPGNALCLRALEVNQAIQTWKNEIFLVEDKDTGVRAFVETPAGNLPGGNVSGRLFGTRNGTPLPGSPLAPVNAGGVVILNPDVVSRRGTLGDSLNFQLPLSWRNGTIELRFDSVANPVICNEPIGAWAGVFDTAGDCKVTVSFFPRTPPSVVFVSVPYIDDSISLRQPSAADLTEQMLRTVSALPTASITVQYDSIATFPSTPTLANVNSALAMKRALDISPTCAINCRTEVYRYFGVLNDNNNDPEGGLANDIPGQVASGFLAGTNGLNAAGFARYRAAHELAHVYGIHHAVDSTMPLNAKGQKQGQCSETADVAAPWFIPFETVGGNRRPVLGPLNAGADEEVWGLETRLLTQPASPLAVVDPRQTFELMSYCAGPVGGGWRWPSKTTYNSLTGSFPSSAEAAEAAGQAMSGDVVFVRANVDFLTNQATLQPATFASGDFVVPTGGSYRAQLLDGAGAELAGANFEPVEMDADTAVPGQPSPPPVGLVLVPLPKPATPVAKIQILHNGNPIGSSLASANAPTVSLVAPTAGQSFGRPTVLFDWNATDPDGGSVWSTVLYSADGGSSWNTLAVDSADTSLTVARNALTASTNARLRVVVSDGVKTASANSAQFSVANNPPDVSITSPPDGHQFAPAQTITFEGVAFDREDGSLDSAIAWSSNRNGALGSGSSISVLAGSLASGTHVISASSTDSTAGNDTATITLEVTGSPTRVLLRSFGAVREEGAVVLRWRTGDETGVAGFNLYRGAARVNRTLIRAKGGVASASYRYVDRSAPRGPLRYRLQAVRMDGTTAWAGSVHVHQREGGTR